VQSVPRADVACAGRRTYAPAVRIRPIVGAIVVACVATIATSARAFEPSDRSFEATEKVTEFAAGEYGRELAFASSCGAPRIWIVGRARPIALDTARACPRSGTYGLSHAGRVVSWGSQDGDEFSLWLALRSLETGSFLRSARRVALVRARSQSGRYGRRVVVLRDGRLDWHDYVPAQTRTLRLPRARSYGDGFCGRPPCTPAELRLEDLHRDLVVYVLHRQIHVLRLSDGKDVVVRTPGKGPVEAQIEGSGLSYSAARIISFVPMPQVTKLLNER
jgi:hypothetical protein